MESIDHNEFESIILEIHDTVIIPNNVLGAYYKIALWWMPQNLTNEQSTLIHVMTWCHCNCRKLQIADWLAKLYITPDKMLSELSQWLSERLCYLLLQIHLKYHCLALSFQSYHIIRLECSAVMMRLWPENPFCMTAPLWEVPPSHQRIPINGLVMSCLMLWLLLAWASCWTNSWVAGKLRSMTLMWCHYNISGALSDCVEDDFPYDMSSDANSGFLDGVYQVIKWQAFTPNKWCSLLDGTGKEL